MIDSGPRSIRHTRWHRDARWWAGPDEAQQDEHAHGGDPGGSGPGRLRADYSEPAQRERWSELTGAASAEQRQVREMRYPHVNTWASLRLFFFSGQRSTCLAVGAARRGRRGAAGWRGVDAGAAPGRVPRARARQPPALADAARERRALQHAERPGGGRRRARSHWASLCTAARPLYQIR